MCTSLTLPTPARTHLFGRTLDLDTHFGEAVTFTPRRYPFSFGNGFPQHEHYAMLGMAAVADGPAASGYPLYAEAMNERGLCVAGLRFKGNAVYAPEPAAGKVNLAPWELIPYLLGRYATVNEVRNALREIRVVDRAFRADLPAAPLHWHIADANPAHGALVVEVTACGMRVWDDRPEGVGVLTNNPPYPYQLARYVELAHLTGHPRKGDIRALAAVAGADLSSLGTGLLGLPGDYSSPSRFVRAATLRRLTVGWMESRRGRGEAGDGEGDVSPVSCFFRILGAVSPMAGAVLTEEGRSHRTLYTCCMDTAAGVYHYFTEADTAVRSVSLGECRTDGEELRVFS